MQEMASNFGDANTVVGDTSYLKRVDETSPNRDFDHSTKHKHRHATNIKSRSVQNDFITLDYTIEERPFFIPIGPEGVIGALTKLDNQLQQVTYMNIMEFVYLLFAQLSRQEREDFCQGKFQLTGRAER